MSKKSEGQTKRNNKKGKYYKTRQCKEINNAVNKSGLTVAQFAKKYDIPRTTLQMWCEGYQRPSEKYYEKLSQICDCDINYFKGIVDYRTIADAEDEIIKLQSKIDKANKALATMNRDKEKLKYTTLIKDNAIKGLNQLSLNLESSINEIDTEIKILNDKYADIVSSMISDVSLWCTLIETADKLISTKTDLDKLTKFENEHNRNIDIGYSYTTRFTPEDEAETTIMKPFINHFFKYIATKEKEFGKQEIDLELEEHKKIMEMLNNKKKDNNKNT